MDEGEIRVTNIFSSILSTERTSGVADEAVTEFFCLVERQEQQCQNHRRRRAVQSLGQG